MYVKTNTVLYKQKQMYNYYINTKNFFGWGALQMGWLVRLKRPTVYLPTHTRPLFFGEGEGVFGDGQYPLAIIVPVAPSDILQLPCSQSSFQKLYFDSTVPFLLISSDV